MKALLSVDERACLASGLCQVMAPDLFTITGDGPARAADQHLDDSHHIELARSAADCCPAAAIAVEALTSSENDDKNDNDGKETRE